MQNPTHSHRFWCDRNPAGCLTCGKTESELLKSFIRTQKEQSYKEGKQEERERILQAGRARFKCGACDRNISNDLLHTLFCQFLQTLKTEK